jgi:hypothetical protein
MVGCALLLMATPAILAHDHPAEPAPAPPAAAPRTPAALPPDVAFGRFIALIRADLMVGDELVKQRDWDVAHRHFMFPLEEIYGVIREDLRGYKTPPFDAALRALARTVDAHSVKQYPKALQKVGVALDAANANLKKRQPNWPSFLLRVSVATLRSAPDEYEDAVANGRIVRPIGYQTARGIILQVDRMIDGVASDLAGKNPEAMRDLREALAQLKEGFGRVNAPRQAVLEVSAVGRLVARVETAADKLM